MILKWITCYPQLEQYERYLAEQRIWNRETMGQERVVSYTMAGGPTAMLLAIEWPDQAAVDRFMAGTHEELMAEHPLGPYLQGYSVAYYDLAHDRDTPGSVERGEVLAWHRYRVPLEEFDELTRLCGRQARIWRRRDEPTEVLLLGGQPGSRELPYPLLEKQAFPILPCWE